MTCGLAGRRKRRPFPGRRAAFDIHWRRKPLPFIPIAGIEHYHDVRPLDSLIRVIGVIAGFSPTSPC